MLYTIFTLLCIDNWWVIYDGIYRSCWEKKGYNSSCATDAVYTIHIARYTIVNN